METIDALKPGQMGRHYRIGTFVDCDDPKRKPRYSAYSRWYSPEWPRCIEYMVIAPSGAAARKAAIEARKRHEAAHPTPEREGGE